MEIDWEWFIFIFQLFARYFEIYPFISHVFVEFQPKKSKKRTTAIKIEKAIPLNSLGPLQASNKRNDRCKLHNRSEMH